MLEVQKGPTVLYLVVVFYLACTFFRLHEFVSPLKLARPLLVCAVLASTFWLLSGDRSIARDPIFRFELAFLMAIAVGVVVVVNHYWWLETTIDYLSNVLVFTLGLATVAKHPQFRRSILLLLMSAFLFLAVWALRHDGFGPKNSWLYDENDIAAVLVVGACLGYGYATEARSWHLRWAGALTGVACVCGLISTNSRGGFVALVFAVASAALFSRKRIRTVFVTIVATALLLPLVPQSYFHEILSIDDAAESYGKVEGQEMERIYEWRRAWEMFLANPVIGVGAGNFPWAVGKFENSPKARLQRGERREIAGRASHSLYFTVLPETGVAGTLPFLAIVWVILRRASTQLRQHPTAREDDSIRIVAFMVGPGLVSYLAAGAFISVLWYPMIWLLAGLAISIPTHADAGRAARLPATPSPRLGSHRLTSGSGLSTQPADRARGDWARVPGQRVNRRELQTQNGRHPR